MAATRDETTEQRAMSKDDLAETAEPWMSQAQAAFGAAISAATEPDGGKRWSPPQIRDGYTINERIADAIIHVLGVVFSIAGVSAMITLAALYKDAATVASIAIYGAGLITVFVTSAAYHMIQSPAWKATLQRLDHAAIFIKIAGTYTPFAVVSIGGWWGVGLLSAVWMIAAVGAPLKLFAPEKIERIAVALYLIQGWMLLFALGGLKLSTAATTLVITGGLLYTVGVVFHLWRSLPFQNAIWHAFVLAGSSCMYAAILAGIALA